MRGLFQRQALPLLLAAGAALLCGGLGFLFLGKVNMDSGSEVQALRDAIAIAGGHHRFGIVSYTHYPNGPAYLLLPFLRYQIIPLFQFRLIPLTVSALAFGFLTWQIYRKTKTWDRRLWGFFALTAFLTQPGFFAWQGGLHEYSYAVSIALISVALGCFERALRPLYFLTGFIAGWIGYDFLFAQMFALVTVRWIFYSGDSRSPLRQVFYRSALDGCSFLSGALLAISSHLLQNYFYFGSWRDTVVDLMEATSIRLGLDLEKSSALHQKSVFTFFIVTANFALQFIYGFSRGGRLRESAGIHGFSNLYTLIPLAVGSLLLLYRTFRLEWQQEESRPRQRLRLQWIYGLGFVGIVLAGFLWVWVMPEHALGHQPFGPRHLLVSVLLVGLAPVLWRREETPAPPLPPLAAGAFWRRIFFYLLPGVPLFIAFVAYRCG
ncbi:MAG: hypothetical protein LHV69_05685 [Elusimicrobia bacterium]|nr:hypothetical protein [Candidatus Obscuribacterium magneticum]